MFGEGQSEVDALSFAFEMSYMQPLAYGFDATLGARLQTTSVDNFADTGDNLPLEYKKQRFTTNLIVAGLGYKTFIQRDNYIAFLHADIEHLRYVGDEGHSVMFSQGGTYTPTTTFNYNEQYTNVSINTGIYVDGVLFNLSISDRNSYTTTTLSVGFNF